MEPSRARYADELARHALPQLCTAADVGLALGGLQPSTVRRHLRHGRLPGRKFSGRWIVERDQLLEFLRPDWVTCADCTRWIPADSGRRTAGGLTVCPDCVASLDAARRKRGS
jgi:hypothetical protein